MFRESFGAVFPLPLDGRGTAGTTGRYRKTAGEINDFQRLNVNHNPSYKCGGGSLMTTTTKAPRFLAIASVMLAVCWLLAPVAGFADTTAQGESQVAVPNQIQQISYESVQTGTVIHIEATSPLVYTSYTPEPDLLVLEMTSTNGSAVPSEILVHDGEVAAISTEATESGPDTRIAIRMAAADVPYHFDANGNRLDVTFEGAKKPIAASDAAMPAAILRNVVPTTDGGKILVALVGDASFADYSDFRIESPQRVIVDLKGITNQVADESLPVATQGLERVRVAQYALTPEPITRVVFDLSSELPYALVSSETGLTVEFGESEAVASEEVAPEAEVAEVQVPEQAELMETALPEPVNEALEPASTSVEPEILDLGDDVTLFEAADASETDLGTVDRGNVPISFETKTIGGGQKLYDGRALSLDFKDADIKDIFRFISDFSGLNVVIDPTVEGRITIKLNDVPWDQSLDIILKNNGLGMVYENNVIRIAPTSKLAREESDRRRLAEERELAVPLKTVTRALSYAKAKDMKKILEKVMSKRGEVIVDDRTNTLILSDVPDKFDTISNLVETLDAPTPQVTIETRIVETTRDFIHDLGIQWGFLGISDAAHGNTTDLIFPNSILVNGAPIAARSGISTNPLDGYAVNLPAPQANSGIGLTFGNVLNTFQLDIALTAFEREGKGRVISAPRVTTQNNVSAEIKSGKQIPVTTIANNTVTTIYVDALMSLKVTPQITAEGTVIMKINIDKSQPDFANLVLGTPPIDKRAAQTSVLVRDGGTTVIGGIFQVTDQLSQQRTPFLSKIPILGNLFKNKGVTRLNNELLIFVTPRIVKY